MSPYSPLIPCSLCGHPSRLHGSSVIRLPIYRCAECGFEQLAPGSIPDPASIYTKDYFRRWGGEKMQEEVRNLKKLTFRRILARIEKYSKPGRILDIGCAKGYFLEEAAERGWDPFGIDINPDAIRVAGQRFEGRVLMGRVEDLPDRFDRFDVLAATDVIEHTPRPYDFLIAARRLLQDGGLIVLTTVNTASLSHFFMGRFWPHYKPEHPCYFDPRNLNTLLRKTGFWPLEFWNTLKTLSPGYLFSVLREDHPPLLGILARYLQTIMPDFLQRLPIPLLLGEFSVIARCESHPFDLPKAAGT
ncbi:MAG: class I SAM-dependent methyltransferase [Syntrophaceae bacterium]|nr:class I SAM-dependent methyltransferase [Syntrophaceae bacterium]